MTINFLLSIIAPWLCGAIFIWRVIGNSPNNLPLTLGLGFFAGFILLTLIMRFWDPANSTISFFPLLLILVLLCVVGIVVPDRPPAHTLAMRGISLTRWKTWVTLVLAGLIVLRYYTLAEELLLRPLFPWDAFTSWTRRAQEWFLQNPRPIMTQNISLNSWVFEPQKETFGTYPHPYTVSLISLWGMLAIGAHDEPISNFYWLLALIATGLTAYGYLRITGGSVLAGLTAVYLITSLPYLNVHSTLAGYADIWLMGTILCSAICLYLWRSQSRMRYLLMAVLFIAYTVTMKRTGLFLGCAVIVAVLLSRLEFAGRLAIGALVLTAALVIGALLIYSEPVNIFGWATVVPAYPLIEVEDLGAFNLDVLRVVPILSKTILSFANWHILFSFVIASLLTSALYRPSNRLRLLREEWCIPLMLYMTVIGVFTISEKYFLQAESFTTLNRTLLYGAPLVIIAIVRLVNSVVKTNFSLTQSSAPNVKPN